MTWTLGRIRTKARQLTGRTTESRLAEDRLDQYINDFYQNHLPERISPDELQTLFTLETSPGTADYGLEPRIRAVYPPLFIGGAKADLTHNVGWFFEQYGDREEQPQGQPEVALYFDRTLWLAPIPDDTYTVQIHALYRPQALELADDQPVNAAWGEALAAGAATLIYGDEGDFEQARAMERLLNYHLQLIERGNILNWHGVRAVPQF